MSGGSARRRTLAQLSGHLLAVGVDPLLALALLQAHNLVRCEPPLHPATVEEIVRWVARKEAAKCRETA